jgi:hydrogenase nickel incorporation protein HypA/HybF
MLEAYLIRNIIEIIEEQLALNNNPQLKKIQMTVGKYYPFNPEAFIHSFKVAAKDKFLDDDFEFDIIQPPMTSRCNVCKDTFEVKDFTFLCPTCQGHDLSLLSGDELRIDFLEVD